MSEEKPVLPVDLRTAPDGETVAYEHFYRETLLEGKRTCASVDYRPWGEFKEDKLEPPTKILDLELVKTRELIYKQEEPT